MSETLEHTNLVRVVLNWVQRVHKDTYGLCIYCDCPTVLQTEKPRSIEGYYPDLYAATVPTTLTIIGEAKTLPDLESPRSMQQFLAFTRFLAFRPNPVLLVAMPWRAKSSAIRIVKDAIKSSNADRIQTHFLIEHPNAKD